MKISGTLLQESVWPGSPAEVKSCGDCLKWRTVTCCG